MTTLWIEGRWERFYLVPHDEEVPAGDLPVRTPRGQTRSLDRAALAPFQVDREVAMAALRDQVRREWRDATGRARGGPLPERWSRAIDDLRDAWARRLG